MKDRYAESGTPAQLLEKYGLTADDIIREVRATIKRKEA
jgi:transketolase